MVYRQGKKPFHSHHEQPRLQNVKNIEIFTSKHLSRLLNRIFQNKVDRLQKQTHPKLANT